LAGLDPFLGLGFLALYLLLGTAIAVASRRRAGADSRGYFVAGYSLGGFLSAMTYAATTYSAFMMVGLVGLSYATGVGALGFELLYLIATLTLLALYAPRVWEEARRRGWVSPAEMLGSLYGSRALQVLVAALYLVALIPYASAQLVGIGKLFAAVPGGYPLGVSIGAAVVLLWTAMAGIWSVATTDAFQGLWMLTAATGFVLWVALFLAPSRGISVAEAFSLLGREGYLGLRAPWSLAVFLAYTIPWIFFAVTNPQVVQRIYMPRDRNALRRMIVYFALFGLTYTALVTFTGLVARGLAIAGEFPVVSDRDLVTPVLLGYAHPLLAAFVFTSIVAAAVSTADSIVLTLTSSAEHDLARRSRAAVRYGTLALLVASMWGFAMLRLGFVVELSVLTSILLLPLAPVTLLAWSSPRLVEGRGPVALTAIALGETVAAVAVALRGVRGVFISTAAGLPIPAWVLIASAAPLLALLRRRGVKTPPNLQG